MSEANIGELLHTAGHAHSDCWTGEISFSQDGGAVACACAFNAHMLDGNAEEPLA